MAETTASNGQIPSSNAHCEVDAGVVFSGQPSSFCIPLSRLGLTGFGEIESLDLSSSGVVSILIAAREPANFTGNLSYCMHPLPCETCDDPAYSHIVLLIGFSPVAGNAHV